LNQVAKLDLSTQFKGGRPSRAIYSIPSLPLLPSLSLLPLVSFTIIIPVVSPLHHYYSVCNDCFLQQISVRVHLSTEIIHKIRCTLLSWTTSCLTWVL